MELIKGKEQEYAEYKAKNIDPYGGCVVACSETWAEMMEEAIASGAELEDVAEKLSHVASEQHGGITGFMYGCCISGLAYFWVHGERLRRWHNGAVLNPAVLVLGDGKAES